MLDINGIEMVTGMVVEIKNAYFKNDNGLYYIDRTPGDVSWLGRDYSLKKIKRNGQLSTAKHNICFWPIAAFTSDRAKNAACHSWNKEHATIEVKEIKDYSFIKAHFEEELNNTIESKEYYSWNWGEDHKEVKRLEKQIEHYQNIIRSLTPEA